MRVPYWLAACFIVVGTIFAGCEAGNSPPEPSRFGDPIAVFREFKGQQGPFEDFGVFVVQRPEMWQELWGDAKVPDVDFSRQTVIVALMGQQPTTGYDVCVTDVRVADEQVTAYISQTYPTPNAVCNETNTYPYDMVVVPKLTNPIAFQFCGMSNGVFPIMDAFQGQQSLVVNPQTLVIRDQASWNSFWCSSFGQTMVAPTIDFSEYMAVAVLLGQKPTGGYGVAITSATQIDDRITVNYRTMCPQPDSVVIQGVTSPYSIAIIPRYGLPVAFRDITDLPPSAVMAKK